MAIQMLLEDSLGLFVSHGCTVVRDRRSLMTFGGLLSDCQLPGRDILATEEGGRLLTGHLGLETPDYVGVLEKELNQFRAGPKVTQKPRPIERVELLV